MQRQLLLVNYCIDPNDPSLAHQHEVLLGLAENFEKVTVITTRNAVQTLPKNIDVHVVPWKPKRDIVNSLMLFWSTLVIMSRSKPSYAFTHMLPKHAIIVGLITRLFGIRHVLWYAHASNPLSLRLAKLIVSGVATSTVGSMPLDGPKIRYIGQGVDRNKFQRSARPLNSQNDFLYVGRMDESKNVKLIIDTLQALRIERPNIRLTLIGNNAEKFIVDSQETWITTKNSILRSDLPKEYEKHEIFIHAFLGSLDKVLIEATLVGLPVLTINAEYLTEFIHWTSTSPITLLNQVTGLYSKNLTEIDSILDQNYSIAISRHELEGWILRLTEFIVNEQ